MTKLSPHFSLAEFTKSNTAIRKGLDNTPPPYIIERLKKLAKKMEEVREICGHKPIIVFSAYRSDKVNKAVGGSPTSSHRDGDAVDFKVVGLSISETIKWIQASDLSFDQLIDEFNGWVHIGFGPKQRNHVLTARKINGKTVYKRI